MVRRCHGASVARPRPRHSTECYIRDPIGNSNYRSVPECEHRTVLAACALRDWEAASVSGQRIRQTGDLIDRFLDEFLDEQTARKTAYRSKFFQSLALPIVAMRQGAAKRDRVDVRSPAALFSIFG